MSIIWKISIGGGTAKTFEAAGISPPALTRRSQAADECDLLFSGDFAGAGLSAAYLDPVVIYRGAAAWFRGKISEVLRTGDGSGETIGYRVSGPWWELEQTVYLQEWMSRAPSTSQDVSVYSSRVLLHTTPNGSAQSYAATLAAVVGYAETRGILQEGTIGAPDMTLWPVEQRDVTIAEVLRGLLRWMPDAATWFDYSLDPPMLNIARMGDMEAATVAFSSGDIAGVSLAKADAALPPCVALFYEWQHRDVGDSSETWRDVRQDVYPLNGNPAAMGAVVSTITLANGNVATQRQKVRVREWPASPEASGAINWIKDHFPALAPIPAGDLRLIACSGEVRLPTGVTPPEPVDGEDDNFDPTKKSGVDIVAEDVPNELVGGSLARWMRKCYGPLAWKGTLQYTGNGASLTEEQRRQARAFFSQYADLGYDDLPTAEISCQFTATNALSKDYSRLTSYQAPESVPQGVAESVYAAMHQTHYQGTARLVQEDCGAVAWLGKKLNVTGLKSEWATMGALIQQVQEDIATGTTTLNVGLPDHLRAGDLVELLRASRGKPAAPAINRSNPKQDLASPVHQGGDAFPDSFALAAPPVASPMAFAVEHGATGKLKVAAGAYQVVAEGTWVNVARTAETTGTKAYLVVHTDASANLSGTTPVEVVISSTVLDPIVLTTSAPPYYVERSNVLLGEVVENTVVQRRVGNITLGIWSINGYAARWPDFTGGSPP